MTTQTETIIWHKYPDEKPPKDGFYLTEEFGEGVDISFFDENCEKVYWGDVIAWADLPCASCGDWKQFAETG